MKKWLSLTLFLSCLCVFNSLKAQDRIITTEGDTLNCKITKTKNDFVHFIFQHEGEARNTLLPINKVISMEKNFYAEPEVNPEDYPSPEKEISHLRFAVSGGWGYRLGKANGDELVKKIRNGFSLGADGHYLFDGHNGLGLQYSFFHKTYSENMLEDKTNIHYIMASYCHLSPAKKENSGFMVQYGIGYAGAKLSGKMYGYTGKITGGTATTALAVGYNFGVSSSTALCLKVSLQAANLRRLKVSDNAGNKATVKLDKDESFNISTLNITLGAVFR